MSDFSFISDSDDEKEVDTILSQAKDQIVLEQIAAINCSGFTDSGLPSHIETRFQKLKSFPSSNPKSSSNLRSISMITQKNEDFLPTKKPPESMEDDIFSQIKKNPERKLEEGSKSVEDDIFSPIKKNPERKSEEGSKSVEDDIFSPIKKNPEWKMEKKSKGSSSRWDSSIESNSPPQTSGCFWCSPKKASKKKSVKSNDFSGGSFGWEKDDELLADLESFSVRSQKRLMKKAMEEEEKINREAEKIVKWAKQASARMDVSGIEDALSDDDYEHFK